MKSSAAQSARRSIDNALTITDLFDGKEFAFDVVVADLDGSHPPVRNSVSDRAYFVIGGEGKISVDDDVYDVTSGDLVSIRAGQVHSLVGSLRYLIITSPPFAPENEQSAG